MTDTAERKPTTLSSDDLARHGLGFVRVFTSLVRVDPKTQKAEKQFFDLPLLPPPQQINQFGQVMTPAFTPWSFFITNVLANRGVLCDGGWIPDRQIDLIMRDPPVDATLGEGADMANVVKLTR